MRDISQPRNVAEIGRYCPVAYMNLHMDEINLEEEGYIAKGKQVCENLGDGDPFKSSL